MIIVIVDLVSVIRSFKNKIESENPDTLAKAIYLTGRTFPLLLEDVMGAIRSFNEIDFIKRPIIEFVNELGIDSGGIFNDTLRIVFEQFSSYKNIEQVGGNGRIFTEGIKKLINPYLLVDFCDYIQIFTSILFLAIVNDAPLPPYLDPIIFHFIFNELENVTIEDLRRHDRNIYNVAMSIKNFEPGWDLDDIDGFKEWAENNNFQKASYTMFNKDHDSLAKLADKIKYDTLIKPILPQLNEMKSVLNKFHFIEFVKSKDVCSRDFIEHFSTPLISSSQVADKLKFEALSSETTVVENWFREWIGLLSFEKLKKFCAIVTGFDYPKEEIMVYFKSRNLDPNVESTKTPTIRTCVNHIEIYQCYDSKEEMFNYLDTLLMFNDDGFTMC